MVTKIEVFNLHLRRARERINMCDEIHDRHADAIKQRQLERNAHLPPHVSDRTLRIGGKMIALAGLERGIARNISTQINQGSLNKLAKILREVSRAYSSNILPNTLQAFERTLDLCYMQKVLGVGPYLFDVSQYLELDDLATILRLHIDLAEKYGSEKLLELFSPPSLIDYARLAQSSQPDI
jgi:hypothetical protein